MSLQEGFARFLAARRAALTTSVKSDEPSETPRSGSTGRSEAKLASLRERFVARCLAHIGTPYETLDCCGLVRRALRDLEEDLGFSPLGYNQAYMYDTLPTTGAKSHTEMQAGDLVFYIGRRMRAGARRPAHDVVHVEVLWPEPGVEGSERCIAARFRGGNVSVFPSFRFTSTAWRLERIEFRSIEPWLRGECVSHCPAHPWLPRARRRAAALAARSIFSSEPSALLHTGTQDELTSADEQDEPASAGEYDEPASAGEQNERSPVSRGTAATAAAVPKAPGALDAPAAPDTESCAH